MGLVGGELSHARRDPDFRGENVSAGAITTKTALVLFHDQGMRTATPAD